MNIPDHISKSLETIFWVRVVDALTLCRYQGYKVYQCNLSVKKVSVPVCLRGGIEVLFNEFTWDYESCFRKL
jgi:hypothetical protein